MVKTFVCLLSVCLFVVCLFVVCLWSAYFECVYLLALLWGNHLSHVTLFSSHFIFTVLAGGCITAVIQVFNFHCWPLALTHYVLLMGR